MAIRIIQTTFLSVDIVPSLQSRIISVVGVGLIYRGKVNDRYLMNTVLIIYLIYCERYAISIISLDSFFIISIYSVSEGIPESS